MNKHIWQRTLNGTMKRSFKSRAAGALFIVVAGGCCLLMPGGLGKVHAAAVIWNLAGGGAWDTASSNWTGGSPDASKYVDGSVDSVTFDKTNGGTITIQGGGVTPLSTTVSATSGTYTFTGGPITGGTLTKSGSGTLTLNSANNFSGPVTVTGGTLIGQSSGAFQAFGTAALVLNGGTLKLNPGSTSAPGNNVTVGASSYTIEFQNGWDKTLTWGTLGFNAGATTFNLIGTGRQRLAFGATTVTGDTVLNPNGGSVMLTLGSLTPANSVAPSTTTTVTLGGTSAYEMYTHYINGAISDNAGDASKKLAVVKSGDTTWRLAGNNTFTGGLTVNAGTLEVTGSNTIGGVVTVNGGTLYANTTQPFGSAALVLNGGLLRLDGAGSFSPGNNVTMGANVYSIELVNGWDRTMTYGSLSFNTSGPSTFNLTGGGRSRLAFGATTIAGDTTFNLAGGGSKNLTLGSLTVADSVATGTTTTVTLSGDKQYEMGTQYINGVISDNASDATKKVGISVSAANSAGQGFTTWVLAADNTYTGPTVITGGTLQIGNGGATGSLSGTASITDNGTLAFNRASGTVTLALPISGTGGLTKDGANTLILSGDNSYQGTTTINGGILNVRHSNALGTNAGATKINYSTLELQGDITLGDTVTLNNSAIRNVSGNNTVTPALILQGYNYYTPIEATSGLLTISGGVDRTTYNDAQRLIVRGAGEVTIAGPIDGGNSFAKEGTGKLTLTAANTFTDTLDINGGVVNIQNALALGASGNGTNVNGGAALEMQGGITIANEPLNLYSTGVGGNGGLRNISGNNTWAGRINLGQNTTARIQSDADTFTYPGLMTSNATLNVGGAGNTNIPGSFVMAWWATNLTKDGSGTLSLTGANYWTVGGGSGGSVTLNGGTLSATAGTGSTDTAATWGTSDNVMTVSNTAGLVVGQPITGNGIAGNTYIGAIVDATHLKMAKTFDAYNVGVNATPTAANDANGATFSAWTSLNTANLTVNAGTLNLNNKASAIRTLTMYNGTITAGSLTAAVASDNTNGYRTDAGRIDASLLANGTFGITKWSANTLILSGANTYTGTTVVNQGTLALDFTPATAPTVNIVNNVANSSALTLGANPSWNYATYWTNGALSVTGKDAAANTQRFNGTTLAGYTFETIAVNAGVSGTASVDFGTITRSGGARVDFSTNGAAAHIRTSTSTGTANTILFGGLATFNRDTWAMMDGTNTEVVGAPSGFYSASGATSLTGHANLTGGNTTLSANTAIDTLRFNDDAARTLTLSGATLTVNTGGILVSDNVLTGGSKITGGSVTCAGSLTIHQHSSQAFEMASAITNNGGTAVALFKTGDGTLLLSGPSTYTGGTYVQSGKIELANATALGSVNGALNVTGTVDLKGVSVGVGSLYGVGVIDNTSLTSATLTIGNGSNGGVFPGVIQGNLALTKVGTAGWTPNNTNTYSGGTTLSAGSANPAGGSVTSANAIVRGPFGTGTVTMAGGEISFGTGGIVIANPIVAQASTTSSFRNEQEGYFTGAISGSGNINSWTGNPKPLHLSGDNSGFSGTWTNDSGSANTLDFASANSGSAAAKWVLGYSTTLTFAGGTIRFGKFDGTGAFAKTGGGGATTVEIGALNLDATYSGNITSSNGTLALAKIGSGKQTLSGTNTYTGGTRLAAGTLNINANAALGASAGGVTFTGDSTLQAGAAAISLAASRTLTVNPGVTASLDTNGYDMTVAGVMNGDGNVIKLGAGKLTLSGANSYAGTTNVNAGQLDVNGTLASASVDVNNAGVLGGAGTISGITNINTGGTINPGAAQGSLTIANTLTFNGATTYQWEVSSSGTDHVQVNGDLAVNGTPTLRLINVDNTTPPASIAIIDYTGSLNASAAWTIDYSATSAGTVSHWTDGTGGWDNNANWDQQGWGGGNVSYVGKQVILSGVTASTSTPSTTTDVEIAPTTGAAAVTGSASPRTVASLVIGDSNSNGYTHSLALQTGGPLTVTNAVSVNPSGTLTANTAGISAAQATVTGAANFGAAVTIPTINSTGTTNFSSGAVATVGALNVTGGTTTIASGASVSGAATVSGATLNLSGSVGTLTATSGAVNTGAGATVGTATLSGGGSGAAVNTQGNYLNVTNSITLKPTAGDIVATYTGPGSFGIKGGDLANGSTGLLLSSAGGKVSLTQEGSNYVPGLEVRGWQSVSSTLTSLDGASYGIPSDITPANSTPGLGGADSTMAYKTTSIDWDSNSGGTFAPGYSSNYAVEYRGKILIATGTDYQFATTSDDRSALWIDPGVSNPSYSVANVQNRYDQGMTLRNSGTIHLESGYHDVIVRFTQGGGGHGLNVKWDTNPSDALNWVLIPGSSFFHGGVTFGAVTMPTTDVTVTASNELALPTGDNTLGGLDVSGVGTALTLSGGTSVTFSSPVSIGTNASVDLNGVSASVSSISGAGSVALGGATLSLGLNDASSTFAGSITGAGTVTKVGAGAVSVATNMQTTNLNVNAGSFAINSGAAASVGTATVSGSSNFTASGGAINGLVLQSGYSGTSTINSGATLGGAVTVPSGTVNLNNTNTMTSLTLTGGTVNFGSGAKVVTADFSSPGGGTANAANPLAITSTLKLPGSMTATLTGGSAFSAGGGNLADNSTARTLTLSGGTLTMAMPYNTAPTYQYYKFTVTANYGNQGYNQLSELHYYLNGVWTAVPAGIIGSPNGGNESLIANANDNNSGTKFGQGGVPYSITYNFGTPSTFTAYNWATANDSTPGRNPIKWEIEGSNDTSSWTVIDDRTGASQGSGPTNIFTWAGANPAQYIAFDGSTNGGATNAYPLGAFQPSGGAIVLPSTSLAATATSTLDLGGTTVSHSLGALTLNGVGTALTLTGAASVTFNGNVAATGTSSLLLSGPRLILAGSNIDATGASDVLTLPDVTLAAPTVNINASGAGTVILSGATTFSSPSPSLVISGGLLQVDATLGSAAVAVAVTVTGTGHLGGHGTISGPILVAAGGSLAPGDSPGVLTVNNTVTLNYGALLDFDLNTPDVAPGTGGNDLLVVNDLLTLNPGLTLNVIPGVDFGDGLYHLMSFGSLADNSSNFQGWSVAGPPDFAYTFEQTAGSIDLAVTIVDIPEPASLALLGSAMVLVSGRRRRRG